MAQRKVAVVGLGYVGIPLAALLAEQGFRVAGIDASKERVDAVNRGELPLKGLEPELPEILRRVTAEGALKATTSFSDCQEAETILVCVDTPLDEANNPDTRRLEDAVANIGRNLQRGALVIIESTVAPGTTRRLIGPALEKSSGLRLGDDFKIAHCPERVMPGRLLGNLRSCDRVLGAMDTETAERIVEIYSRITAGQLHVTDLVTAEIVKTAENAYRDVQIAFANEVALICEELGADAFEVRRLVNTCPFRDMHIPGAGVGGHCLPKDPWLLASGARNARPILIPAARAVNEDMPRHVAELVEKALNSIGSELVSSVVTVLGASFLPDCGDTRSSPSIMLAKHLKEAGELRVHDPYVDELAGIMVNRDLEGALEGADVAVFMVAHSQYSAVTPKYIKGLMRRAAVVDGRNLFNKEEMEREGFTYLAVGKGTGPASPRDHR